MDFRTVERKIIVSSRFFTLISVFGSLAGSLLMFFLGFFNIYEAFAIGLDRGTENGTQFGTNAVISVIEGLDRFLIGIVMLYFSYGVYSLFIHPEETEEALSLPIWLQIKQIGQLKQVIAEVIIIVLFVLFLRVALQTFTKDAFLGWPEIAQFLLLPLSVMLLAVALRLVNLHPKPPLPTKPDA